MRAWIVLVTIALANCAGDAQLQSAMTRLPQHASCAMECAACIAAIHAEGDGMDAQPVEHIRCAASCARCGVDLAEDVAVIAAAGEDSAGADVDVSPAPLPEAEATPALVRLLPPELASCSAGD